MLCILEHRFQECRKRVPLPSWVSKTSATVQGTSPRDCKGCEEMVAQKKDTLVHLSRASWQHGEPAPWHNRVVSPFLYQTVETINAVSHGTSPA